MATGRDDFVIAIRSAFLKKKDKQKFSLLTLIFLSIFVIVLSNFNFKAIQFVKLGINEVIYRSSHIASIPENKFKEITLKFKSHMNLYESHRKELIKIENTEQIKLLNDFLTAENKKLRKLIDETIISEEIFARVLIDKHIRVNNENFCLSFFFKKADLMAITKSSLPVAIFFNIQIT